MPDARDIQLAAAAFQTDERYIDKDWHLVRAVGLIAALGRDGVRPVFSGGTSLSAAWRLIPRFSEDIDFKVEINARSASAERRLRSTFRLNVIEALSGAGFVLDGTPLIGNKSQFFRASFHYGPTLPQALGIRPTLQVEMTFSGCHLPPVTKQVQSLLGRTLDTVPEVAAVDCIDPIETAADKLSALAWRAAIRDRSAEDDDPSIVRHLHDLAALAPLAGASPALPGLALKIAQTDASRAGRSLDGRQLLASVVPTITSDAAWKREYAQFVGAVSFGPQAGRIGFDDAVAACRELIRRILE